MRCRSLFATTLLVATPFFSSFAADEAAVRPQTNADPSVAAGAPAPTDAQATADKLQTARKPDASPFEEIKILPSF